MGHLRTFRRKLKGEVLKFLKMGNCAEIDNFGRLKNRPGFTAPAVIDSF